MYDVEMGFPGLIIDGTARAGGGGEPPSLSESYEDMEAGAEGDHAINSIGSNLEISLLSDHADLAALDQLLGPPASPPKDTRAGATSIKVYNPKLCGGRYNWPRNGIPFATSSRHWY